MNDLEAILATNGDISKATEFNGIKLPRINPKSKPKPCEDETDLAKEKRAEVQRIKVGRTAAKPITIRGVEYPSVTAAANELEISKATIYGHIRNKTLDRAGLGREGMKYKPRKKTPDE